MSKISNLKRRRSSTVRLLNKVSLDPVDLARAQASAEKAERIADFLDAAAEGVLSAIAWVDRSASMAARRWKSAFSSSVQH